MKIQLKRNSASSSSMLNSLSPGEPLWFKDQLYIGSVGGTAVGAGTQESGGILTSGSPIKVWDPNSRPWLEDGFTYPRAVQDADGNWYRAVVIGNQVWLAENWRCTRLPDGTPLVRQTGEEEADFSDTEARYFDWSMTFAWYRYRYGLLYNGVALMNGADPSDTSPSGVQGLAPSGWHIPSAAEFTTLTEWIKSQPRYRYTDYGVARALSTDKTSRITTADDGNKTGLLLDQNNKSGFDLAYGGRFYYNYNQASRPTYRAFLWTASESSVAAGDFAIFSQGYTDEVPSLITYAGSRKNFYSVRLLSDKTPQQFWDWYTRNYGTYYWQQSEPRKLWVDHDVSSLLGSDITPTEDYLSSSNSWLHTYSAIKKFLIPLNNIIRVKIKARPSNAAIIAFCKGPITNTNTSGTRQQATVVSGHGWTSVSAGDEQSFEVPSEAEYLYVAYNSGSYGTTINIPDYIYFTGSGITEHTGDGSGFIKDDGTVDTNTYLTSFTETDPTVSAWAKAANKPSYSYSEITGTTNVSTFTNDAGYLTSFTETDPTVPAWAKAESKPSYTLDEVADGNTRKLLTIGTTGSTAAAGDHNHDSTYVKLNSGAAEQTIQSSISSISNGVINLWRKSNAHCFLGFSKGSSTMTFLGGIGFKSDDNNNLYKLKQGETKSYYKILDTENSGISGSTITLGGSELTVAVPGDIPANIVNKISTTAGAHETITNQSGNVSFKVPTNTSHLTNDSGFLTAHQTVTGITSLELSASDQTYLTVGTTAYKMKLPSASTTAAGITKVGASGGAAAFDHNHDSSYVPKPSTSVGGTTTPVYWNGSALAACDAYTDEKVTPQSLGTSGSTVYPFLTVVNASTPTTNGKPYYRASVGVTGDGNIMQNAANIILGRVTSNTTATDAIRLDRGTASNRRSWQLLSDSNQDFAIQTKVAGGTFSSVITVSKTELTVDPTSMTDGVKAAKFVKNNSSAAEVLLGDGSSVSSAGTAGKVLTSAASGAPSWQDLPTASTSAAGIIQIGTGSDNAAAGNHNHNDSYVPKPASSLGNSTTPVYWNGSALTACDAYTDTDENLTVDSISTGTDVLPFIIGNAVTPTNGHQKYRASIGITGAGELYQGIGNIHIGNNVANGTATKALIFDRGTGSGKISWTLNSNTSNELAISRRLASTFTKKIAISNTKLTVDPTSMTDGVEAAKFVKNSGTVAQILLANGDNIAAGTASYYLKANGTDSAPTWAQFPTIPSVGDGIFSIYDDSHNYVSYASANMSYDSILHILGGAGLTSSVSDTDGAAVTLSHDAVTIAVGDGNAGTHTTGDNTSGGKSITADDGCAISKIYVDDLGHITKADAFILPTDTNQKVKCGNTTFDANDTVNITASGVLTATATTTSGSEKIEITHNTSNPTATTNTSVSTTAGSKYIAAADGYAISKVYLDDYGHATKADAVELTDTKVTQTKTADTNSSWRPLILGSAYAKNAPSTSTALNFNKPTTSNQTDTVYATHLGGFKPSTGELIIRGLFRIDSSTQKLEAGSTNKVWNTNGTTTELATVATTGSYNDLDDTPTITDEKVTPESDATSTAYPMLLANNSSTPTTNGKPKYSANLSATGTGDIVFTKSSTTGTIQYDGTDKCFKFIFS